MGYGPYTDHSYEALFEILEQRREDVRWNREVRDRLRPNDRHAADQHGLLMDDAYAEINAIQEELTARREAKEEREAVREAARQAQAERNRQREAARAAALEARRQSALAGWFQRTNVPSLPPIERVGDERRWQVNGRYYCGVFTPQTGRLAVWMRVKAGTPGAETIGGRFYLPANNMREIGRAIRYRWIYPG